MVELLAGQISLGSFLLGQVFALCCWLVRELIPVWPSDSSLRPGHDIFDFEEFPGAGPSTTSTSTFGPAPVEPSPGLSVGDLRAALAEWSGVVRCAECSCSEAWLGGFILGALLILSLGLWWRGVRSSDPNEALDTGAAARAQLAEVRSRRF
jgi:hypothetical protein